MQMHRVLDCVGALTWPEYVAATHAALFPQARASTDSAATAARTSGNSGNSKSPTVEAASSAASPVSSGAGAPAFGAKRPVVTDLSEPFEALLRFLDDVDGAVAPLVSDDAADTDDGMLSTSPGRLSAAAGHEAWASMPEGRLRASARADWALLLHLVATLELSPPPVADFAPALALPKDAKGTKAAVAALFGGTAARHVLATGAPAAPTTDDEPQQAAEEAATQRATSLAVAQNLCALVVCSSLRAKVCLLPPPAKKTAEEGTANAASVNAPAGTSETQLLEALAAPLRSSAAKAPVAAMERYL
eukprot:CAMPEP_0174864910 /NCGR_PEP_ID=MMETSP1114-20130205/59383_1 /TAXON_ID=312471 /ORGANISM="Neobodo designis, Strain CCAP 1951/1" /LENGTH=304 /DNA_ID=CAMNT_0016100025 /DNA_START=138 /DNA_END=1049 /DNA_ORIENTATION=+